MLLKGHLGLWDFTRAPATDFKFGTIAALAALGTIAALANLLSLISSNDIWVFLWSLFLTVICSKLDESSLFPLRRECNYVATIYQGFNGLVELLCQHMTPFEQVSPGHDPSSLLDDFQ